jgi:hypothetical protein
MSETNTDLALIDANDLSLVEGNNLNASQLALILKRTPTQYVHKRPAKGGGTWDYVTGGYVKKCLNLMFGWDWDFEIIEQMVLHGEAIVKGRLTCRSNYRTIIKMQFGNKDVIYKKQTPEEVAKGLERIPLSIGNDLKSAATDCLKKCAAEIGIAADIYNKEDFKEVKVASEKDFEDVFAEIVELFEWKKDLVPSKDYANIERVIENKEKTSYNKILKILKSL